MDSFCNSCLKFNELTSINKDYISFDKQASKENETKIQDVNGKPWAQRCCTPLPDQIRAQMGFDGVRWGLKRWSIPTQDRMVRHAFRASERVRWGSKMMQAALRDETLRDASCAAGENQPTPCLSFLQLTLGIDTKTEIDIYFKIKELAQKRREKKVKQGSLFFDNHDFTRYDFST